MLVTLKGQRINEEQISLTPRVNLRLKNVSENSKSVMLENMQTNKTTVGLLAQLVERCTGVAEIMGENPVQA